MKFSIPTNWDDGLIAEFISNNMLGQIEEIYGKFSLDGLKRRRVIFSSKLAYQKKKAEHIKKLLNNGFKFNYLLDNLCLDNLEFTIKWQKSMRQLLEWLSIIGIDSVTVSNIYFAMWIKKNYPLISITVSDMANVNSPRRAKFWEDIGADVIILPGPVANRNFSLIKLIKKSIKSKIRLVANNACVINCPTFIDHALMNSHSCDILKNIKDRVFDYNLFMCRQRCLENSINFIRSDWIRPEDIIFYEELSVDSIKLVDDNLSSSMIIKIINAYFNRSYQGNLVDLFPSFNNSSSIVNKDIANKLSNIDMFLSLKSDNVLKYPYLFSSAGIFIDNQKLNNFLEEIPKECDMTSCDICRYCKTVADRVVKYMR